MRRFVITILVVSICLSSCSALDAFFAGESGNIEFVRPDDTAMNSAIQQAKDTFPLFIKAFQSPKPSQSHFAIKVRFPYDNGKDGEHIWVSQLTFNDGQFTGIVENEPIYVKDIKLGDSILIKNDDVTDWMIIDNGKLIGGFTIYVLRDNMTSNERKQFESGSSFVMGDKPSLP